MADSSNTNSGGGGSNANPSQVTKLREANNKYKSLLKMAKERIQKQEEELEKLQAENKTVKSQVDAERLRNQHLVSTMDDENDSVASGKIGGPAGGGGTAGGGAAGSGGSGNDMASEETSSNILRVCQRIRLEVDIDDNNDGGGGGGDEYMMDHTIGDAGDVRNNNKGDDEYEIWSLIEYELQPPDVDALPPPQQHQHSSSLPSPKRWKSWKRFATESDMSDYIRRDTGEPIILPPYSLSPDQSAAVERESRQAVSHITEEFRRYRVRAEVLRKQSDATLRALHSNNAHRTQRKIEGEDLANTLQQAKSEHNQLVQLQKELKEQEQQWKEAYDVLLAENNALKGSGAEALLASQWRHRYEISQKEKEDMEMKLETANRQLAEGNTAQNTKYEQKYREMKESFRLYRKKAKEIFEQQQRGELPGASGGGGGPSPSNGHNAGSMSMAAATRGGGGVGGLGAVPPSNASFSATMNDRVGEDARLAYLRNLMVNFLTADDTVREHMETAICTVLKFSEEDMAKVEKARRDQDSWF